MNIKEVSDQDLLSALDQVCFDTRRLLGRLLTHLGEVEERRLYAKAAYPSMFEFCIRKLGMSEGETYRRLTGARLVARFPALLPWLTSGSLHLTGLVQLRELWTAENIDELARAMSGKSKLEIAQEIARRAPRPDVPDRLQKLPTLPVLEADQASSSSSSSSAEASSSSPTPSPAARPPELGRNDQGPGRRDRIEPLSEHRFKLQFTVGEAFRQKLAKVQDLMRHRNIDGNLETVFAAALDALHARLEKERLAKTDRPQTNPRPADPDTVTAATRREVFALAGGRCTFVAANGVRCSATTLLEIDHIVPRAEGGSSEPTNLRVLCRTHNQLHAEQDFGKAHIQKQIRVRAHFRSLAATRLLGGLSGSETHLRQRSGEPSEQPAHLRQRSGEPSEQPAHLRQRSSNPPTTLSAGAAPGPSRRAGGPALSSTNLLEDGPPSTP